MRQQALAPRRFPIGAPGGGKKKKKGGRPTRTEREPVPVPVLPEISDDVDPELYKQARVTRENAYWRSRNFPEIDLDKLEADCNARIISSIEPFPVAIEAREGIGRRQRPFPTHTGDVIAVQIVLADITATSDYVGDVTIVMKDMFKVVTRLATVSDVRSGDYLFFSQRHEGDPEPEFDINEKKKEAEEEKKKEKAEDEPDNSDLESDTPAAVSKYKYASKLLRMRGSDEICANVLNVSLKKEGQGSFEIRCDCDVKAFFFFLSYAKKVDEEGKVIEDENDTASESGSDDDDSDSC